MRVEIVAAHKLRRMRRHHRQTQFLRQLYAARNASLPFGTSRMGGLRFGQRKAGGGIGFAGGGDASDAVYEPRRFQRAWGAGGHRGGGISTVFSKASGKSAKRSSIVSGGMKNWLGMKSRGRFLSVSTQPPAMHTRASRWKSPNAVISISRWAKTSCPCSRRPTACRSTIIW